ncbi:MAG: hypothetical protein FWD46_00725 [Cystobacterineae bacterium]|nr:hypothetical protein [Cystobacterineae bacterium]
MNLKDSHLAFISEFTEKENNIWELQKFETQKELVNMDFQKALEHSQTMCDKLRTKNIELLRDTFQEDENNIRKKDRLLTEIESKILSNSTSQAYESALAAECARNNKMEGMCK